MTPKTRKTTTTAAATSTTTTNSSGSSAKQVHLSQPPPEYFPFAWYSSVVGVHSSLFIFSALFIPRTPLLLRLSRLDNHETPTDHPQLPFLNAITISPTVTLASMTFAAILLQSWWARCLCDWVAGNRLQHVSPGESSTQPPKTSRTWQELRDAWLATLLASFLIHATLILFGAPLLQHALRTYFLALFLSLLTVLTPAYTLGPPFISSWNKNDSQTIVNRMTWIKLFAELNAQTPVERALVYPAVGAFVGCWIGVLPIALDWDRPWQSWPLTPAFGALAGYVVASIHALTFSAVKNLGAARVATSSGKAKPKTKPKTK